MDRDSRPEYLRDYLDFDLEIREGEFQAYAVAVRSPAGEAEEEMRFPFDERQLSDRLKDLEIALLRSGGTRRRLSYESCRGTQGSARYTIIAPCSQKCIDPLRISIPPMRYAYVEAVELAERHTAKANHSAGQIVSRK